MIADTYQKPRPQTQLVLKPNFSDKVALVKFYPGLDPAVIDFYVDRASRASCLKAQGLGHVSKFCFDAVKRATAKGVVVALASQCIWGRVDMNVYDTGRDLLSFGVVPLDDMFPETGLVKLMWALGQTRRPQRSHHTITN
jgi:glutamyl-tRNA(Gln) amidotransferase subunit D